MGGAPHRGLARPWCGRAWRSPNRRAADRFDRVAISSGSLAGAGESRSAAERHGSPRATVPTSARATSRIRGRGDRPQGRLERRRSRASCCRSARFSRTRSVRAFSAAHRVPSRASTRDIATQARLTGDPRPAWRPIFWPRTGRDSPNPPKARPRPASNSSGTGVLCSRRASLAGESEETCRATWSSVRSLMV